MWTAACWRWVYGLASGTLSLVLELEGRVNLIIPRSVVLRAGGGVEPEGRWLMASSPHSHSLQRGGMSGRYCKYWPHRGED